MATRNATARRVPSARTRTRRRNARRRAVSASLRSIGQMLTVGIGGAMAGGLLVLAAFPGAVDPVPPVALVVGAGGVGLLTLLGARRLGAAPDRRPGHSGRSRR